LQQTVIPFYPKAPGEELQGELTIINSGSRAVTAQLTWPDGFTLDEHEVRLEPQTASEPIVFTFLAPPAANWTGYIVVTAPGAEPVKAEVVCGARPTLTLMNSTLNVVEGDDGPFTFIFRHQGGGPAFITDAACLDNTFEVVSGMGVVQPGGDLAVKIRPIRSLRGQQGGVFETISLSLLRGGTVDADVTIRVEAPPRLVHSADYEHLDFESVIPGRPKRRVLWLKNAGVATLTIAQMELKDQSGLWKLELEAALPLQMRGGNSQQVVVTFRGAQPGLHQTKLLIVSNDPERPEFNIAVEANVLEDVPVTAKFVGIDFGTTNSCICVEGARRR
jgi:hypothetical protein